MDQSGIVRGNLMGELKKILIVEDNIAAVKYYTAHLKKAGYSVLTANGGFEGLSMARRERPDLILLDILLPDLDGHKICRILKFDKECEKIPIAILTSRDTEEDAEQARKCGADAFLIKTTRIEIVLDVIKNILEGKNAKKPEPEHNES
jgi:DNA-binding response OmpR family regulator